MKTIKIAILMICCVQFSQAQFGVLEAVNGLILGNNTGTINGSLRYTGTDFEGRIGGVWTSLTNGGSSPVWIQNGPSIYYPTGNVGIGTGNPGSLLHVNATGSFSKTVNFTSGDLSSTDDLLFLKVGTNSPDASQIIEASRGTAKVFVVNADGSTGIGVADPQDALHIDGDIRFEGGQYLEWYESAVRKAYLRYTGTDLLLDNSETSGSIDISTQDDLVFKTGASGNTRMVINEDGNVGIGTVGPGSKLQIFGDGTQVETVTMTALTMPANNNLLKLYTGTSSSLASQFIECSVGTDNVFSLDTDGEMRFFNSSAGLTIELKPEDRSLTLGNNAVNSSESGALYFDENTGVSTLCGIGFQYDGAANNLYMVGGCSGTPDTLSTYNRDGQWAIGTQDFASGYLVSIGGKVICEELQVELEGSWPDYVFNEQYDLMNLTDLERYITQENHLPNIPTAEQIESEGIAVGEMQKKMMEKIEELTLYIIQLKKEIDGLKQK